MSFGNINNYNFHNNTSFWKNVELNKNGKVEYEREEIDSSSLNVNDDSSVSKDVKALNELLAEIWGSDNDITESQFKELLDKLETVCNERIDFNIDTVPKSNQYMLQEDENTKILQFTYDNGQDNITVCIELVKSEKNNAPELILSPEDFDDTGIEEITSTTVMKTVPRRPPRITQINNIINDIKEILDGDQSDKTAENIVAMLKDRHSCTDCHVELDKYSDNDLTYVKLSFVLGGVTYTAELPEDVKVYLGASIPQDEFTVENLDILDGDSATVVVDFDRLSEIFTTVVKKGDEPCYYILNDDCRNALRKEGLSDKEINNLDIQTLLIKFNLIKIVSSGMTSIIDSLQEILNKSENPTSSEILELLAENDCENCNIEVSRDTKGRIKSIHATYTYNGKSCEVNLKKGVNVYSTYDVENVDNYILSNYFEAAVTQDGKIISYTLNEAGLKKLENSDIDKSNLKEVIKALGDTVGEDSSVSGALNNTIKTLQNLLDSGTDDEIDYGVIVNDNSIKGRYTNALPIIENGKVIGVKIIGLQLDGESYTIELRKGTVLIDGNDIKDTKGLTETKQEYGVSRDSLINKYFTAAVTKDGTGVYYYLNAEGLAKLNTKDGVDEHSPIEEILTTLASGLTDTDIKILNFCSNPDASIEDLVDLENNNSDINYVLSNMSGAEATITITNKANGYSQDWKITMTEENKAQLSAVYLQSSFDTLQALLNSGTDDEIDYGAIVNDNSIKDLYTNALPIIENGKVIGVKITELQFFKPDGPSYTINLHKGAVTIDSSDIEKDEEKNLIISRYFDVTVSDGETPVIYSLNSDAIRVLKNKGIDITQPLSSDKIEEIFKELRGVIPQVDIDIMSLCSDLENCENGEKGADAIKDFINTYPDAGFSINRAGNSYNIQISSPDNTFEQTVKIERTEKNQVAFDNLCFLQTINNLQKLVNTADYGDIVNNNSVYGKYTSASPVEDENGNLTGVSFKGLIINDKEYDITFTIGQEIFLKEDIKSAAGDMLSKILEYFTEAGGVHGSNEPLFYTLNEKGIRLLGKDIPTGGITAIVKALIDKIASSITAINNFISDDTRLDYVNKDGQLRMSEDGKTTVAEEMLAGLPNPIIPDSINETDHYIEYATDEGVVRIDYGNLNNNLIIDAKFIQSNDIDQKLLNKYFTPVVTITQDGEREVLYYVLDSEVPNYDDIKNKLVEDIENVKTAINGDRKNIDEATVKALYSSLVKIEKALDDYSLFMENHTADSTDFGTNKPDDKEFSELSEKLKQFAISRAGTDVEKALQEKWEVEVEEFIIKQFINEMNTPDGYKGNTWTINESTETELRGIIDKTPGNEEKTNSDGTTRQSTLLEDIKDYMKREFGVFFNDENFNTLYGTALKKTVDVVKENNKDVENIPLKTLVDTFFAEIYKLCKQDTKAAFDSFADKIHISEEDWTRPVPEGSNKAYNTYLKAYDEYIKAGEDNIAALSALEEAEEALEQAERKKQSAYVVYEEVLKDEKSTDTIKESAFEEYQGYSSASTAAQIAYQNALYDANKAKSAFEVANDKLTEALNALKESAFGTDARSAEIDALENAIGEYTSAVTEGSDLTELTKTLTEAQDAFKTKILAKIQSNNTEAAITKSIKDLLNKNNTEFYNSVKSALISIIGANISDDELEELFNEAVEGTIKYLKQKNMLDDNIDFSDITNAFITKLYEKGINKGQSLNNQYGEFLSLLSWLQDSEAFKKRGQEFLNLGSSSDGLYQDLERISTGTYMEYYPTTDNWSELLGSLISDEDSVESKLFNNIKQYIINWLVEDTDDETRKELRNYLLVNGKNVFDNLLKYVWGMTFGDLSSENVNEYGIKAYEKDGKYICSVSSFAQGFLKCFIAQLKSNDDIQALKTIMRYGPSGADSTSSTGAVASVFEQGSIADPKRNSAFDSYHINDLSKAPLNIPDGIIKDPRYFTDLGNNTYKLNHNFARIYFSIEEFYEQCINTYGKEGYSGAYKTDVDNLINYVSNNLNEQNQSSTIGQIMELWLDDQGNIKTQGINKLEELWNYIQNNLVEVLENEYPQLYDFLNKNAVGSGVENLIFNIWNSIKQNADKDKCFITVFIEELYKVLKSAGKDEDKNNVNDLRDVTRSKKYYAVGSKNYWIYQLSMNNFYNEKDFGTFFAVTKTDEYGNKTYGLNRDKITDYYTYERNGEQVLSDDFKHYVLNGDSDNINKFTDKELFTNFMKFVMNSENGRVPQVLIDVLIKEYKFSTQQISRYFEPIKNGNGYRIKSTTIKTNTLGALKNHADKDTLANYTSDLTTTIEEIFVQVQQNHSLMDDDIVRKITDKFDSADQMQQKFFIKKLDDPAGFVDLLQGVLEEKGLQELFGKEGDRDNNIKQLARYLWNKTIGTNMFMSGKTFKGKFQSTVETFFSNPSNITNFIANPDAFFNEDDVTPTAEQSGLTEKQLTEKPYYLTDKDINVLFHKRTEISNELYFINGSLYTKGNTVTSPLLDIVNKQNYIKYYDAKDKCYKDYKIEARTTVKDFISIITSSDTRFKKEFLSATYGITDDEIINRAFLFHADGTYSMKQDFVDYLQDNDKPISIGAIIEALQEELKAKNDPNATEVPKVPNLPEPKASDKLSDKYYTDQLKDIATELKANKDLFKNNKYDTIKNMLTNLLYNRGLDHLFGGKDGIKTFFDSIYYSSETQYGRYDLVIDSLVNYFKDTKGITDLTKKLVELGISISDGLKKLGEDVEDIINKGQYNRLFELAKDPNVKLTIENAGGNTYNINLIRYNKDYNINGNDHYETYSNTITITNSSAFETFLDGNGHVFLADNWGDTVTAKDIPTVEEITNARLERALNTNMSVEEIVGNLPDSDYEKKDGKYYIAIVDEEYSNGTGYIVEELKESFYNIIKNSVNNDIINQLYYYRGTQSNSSEVLSGMDAFNKLFDDAWKCITVSDYGIFYDNELGDYTFDYRNDDYKDIGQMYSDLLDRIESCLNFEHTISKYQDPYNPSQAN